MKLFFMFLMTPLVLLAVPTVSDVSVTQPVRGRVRIAYNLDAPAVVTLDIQTNGVSIGGANIQSLKGDVNKKVEAGAHIIDWRACASWPDRVVENVRAIVTAWPVGEPPPYMVADLRAIGNKGVRYYARAEDVPGGLSDKIYKHDHLLMRKCEVSGRRWMMGSPESENERGADELRHFVTFTNDYYIGVYKVTQSQYTNVCAAFPSPMAFTNLVDSDSRPINYLSYSMIRGAAPAINWPLTGTNVDNVSTIAAFRNRTGLVLDLPTEAQWEIACRAGTLSAYNSGNSLSDKAADEVAWYAGNLTKIEFTISPGSIVYRDYPLMPVGLKMANNWGLYDMHGNGVEFCRDWYGDYSDVIPSLNRRLKAFEAVEPIGLDDKPQSIGTYADAERVVRGSPVSTSRIGDLRSAYRGKGKQGITRSWNTTFRLVCPAVAK